MKENDIYEILGWDSDFFGFTIARLKSSRITAQELNDVLDMCRKDKVRCLYFLCDFNHTKSIGLAEQNSFDLVDTRVTLELNTDNINRTLKLDIPPEFSIRPYQDNDLKYLKNVAKGIYPNSRFHQDPNFDNDLADKLYVRWIENSCKGSAPEMVFVLTQKNLPVGYITCNIQEPSLGNIGLFGIASSLQGQGFGTTLLCSAMEWFIGKNVKSVEVVTQERNIAAQRLYQTVGFKTKTLQLWYHKWLSQ